MKVIKLSEAKAQLSRYVDFVRRGGRVRILVRDVPSADLVAVGSDEPEGADDAALLALERRGWIRRGGSAPRELLRPGPRARGKPLSDLVVEERRSGR